MKVAESSLRGSSLSILPRVVKNVVIKRSNSVVVVFFIFFIYIYCNLEQKPKGLACQGQHQSLQSYSLQTVLLISALMKYHTSSTYQSCLRKFSNIINKRKSL